MECWKQLFLEGLEGDLWVSDEADVIFQNTIRRQIFAPDGYLCVNLKIKHLGWARRKVHRLVALVHVPNPDNKPIVGHIDHTKINNQASNLVWCTDAENFNHFIHHSPAAAAYKFNRKKTLQRNTVIRNRRSFIKTHLYNTDFKISFLKLEASINKMLTELLFIRGINDILGITHNMLGQYRISAHNEFKRNEEQSGMTIQTKLKLLTEAFKLLLEADQEQTNNS